MKEQFNNPLKGQSKNSDQQVSQNKQAYPETDLGNTIERQSAGFYEISPEHSNESFLENLKNDAEPDQGTTIQMASGLEEDTTGNKARKEQDFTG